MNLDLFNDGSERLRMWREDIYPGAVVLRRFALKQDKELLDALLNVISQSPLRESFTPGGFKMSVLTSGCGDYGSSNDGDYRMDPIDPVTKLPWPNMPEIFYELGVNAAKEAGFVGYEPNMTHINQYSPGSKLGMHQDRGESDTDSPIVSLSLGLPAVFKLGGFERSAPVKPITLEHGDVIVWGGASRMRFHGILPIKAGIHHMVGSFRYNLTVRRVNRSSHNNDSGYFI